MSHSVPKRHTNLSPGRTIRKLPSRDPYILNFCLTYTVGAFVANGRQFSRPRIVPLPLQATSISNELSYTEYTRPRPTPISREGGQIKNSKECMSIQPEQSPLTLLSVRDIMELHTDARCMTRSPSGGHSAFRWPSARTTRKSLA